MTRKVSVGQISHATVERLFRYRGVLKLYVASGRECIFSHELAREVSGTAAQVRRDFMELDLSGSPQRGYEISRVLGDLDRILTPEENTIYAALVGVGRLGSALMSYFLNRGIKVDIAAAFDSDERKLGEKFAGVDVYRIDTLKQVVKEKKILIGLIAVPASEAQTICDEMVTAGIRWIINFTPTHVKGVSGVYIEDVDITLAVEKTAFYAMQLENSNF